MASTTAVEAAAAAAAEAAAKIPILSSSTASEQPPQPLVEPPITIATTSSNTNINRNRNSNSTTAGDYVIYGLLAIDQNCVDWFRIDITKLLFQAGTTVTTAATAATTTGVGTSAASAVASAKKSAERRGSTREDVTKLLRKTGTTTTTGVGTTTAAAAVSTSAVQEHHDELAFAEIRTRVVASSVGSSSTLTPPPPLADPTAEETTTNRRSSFRTRSQPRRSSFRTRSQPRRRNSSANHLMTPEATSYVVFDAHWHPVFFSPRHTNQDVALILQAATVAQQEDDQEETAFEATRTGTTSCSTTTTDVRTTNSTSTGVHPPRPTQTQPAVVEELLAAGTLPIVPIRRTAIKQLATKKSVEFFFNKEAIKWFACGPYRCSPRTIYNFPLLRNTSAATTTTAAVSVVRGKTPAPTTTARRTSATFRKLSTTAATATGKAKESFWNLVKSNVNNNNNYNKSPDTTNMGARGAATAATATTIATEEETKPSSGSQPSGYVAITIDDVPCRFDTQNYKTTMSLLPQVLDLLTKYNQSKATFMVVSEFANRPCHQHDMLRLLREGHELANHGIRDVPMDTYPTVQQFVIALDDANRVLTTLQRLAFHDDDDDDEKEENRDADAAINAGKNNDDDANKKNEYENKAKTNDATMMTNKIGVKWYRAPQAKYTKLMEEGLAQRDMYNVMCDSYAACPIVEDGPWLAQSLNKQITSGSIAIIHMPERGFREYCYEALDLLLNELVTVRNFKCVTVSQLQQISVQQQQQQQQSE